MSWLKKSMEYDPKIDTSHDLPDNSFNETQFFSGSTDNTANPELDAGTPKTLEKLGDSETDEKLVQYFIDEFGISKQKAIDYVKTTPQDMKNKMLKQINKIEIKSDNDTILQEDNEGSGIFLSYPKSPRSLETPNLDGGGWCTNPQDAANNAFGISGGNKMEWLNRKAKKELKTIKDLEVGTKVHGYDERGDVYAVVEKSGDAPYQDYYAYCGECIPEEWLILTVRVEDWNGISTVGDTGYCKVGDEVVVFLEDGSHGKGKVKEILDIKEEEIVEVSDIDDDEFDFDTKSSLDIVYAADKTIKFSELKKGNKFKFENNPYVYTYKQYDAEKAVVTANIQDSTDEYKFSVQEFADEPVVVLSSLIAKLDGEECEIFDRIQVISDKEKKQLGFIIDKISDKDGVLEYIVLLDIIPKGKNKFLNVKPEEIQCINYELDEAKKKELKKEKKEYEEDKKKKTDKKIKEKQTEVKKKVEKDIADINNIKSYIKANIDISDIVDIIKNEVDIHEIDVNSGNKIFARKATLDEIIESYIPEIFERISKKITITDNIKFITAVKKIIFEDTEKENK